jgi:hypothetical protein
MRADLHAEGLSYGLPMRKVVSPGGATKPATTFKVGDRVVLYPTAVLTITAIGKPGGATPTFEPLRALVGPSPLQPAGDGEPAYALRFLDAERDAFRLDVKATTRPPLRHLSTAHELATFLAVLREELQNARVTPPPKELLKELAAAGNDLVKLARLYPYLPATEPARGTLEAFFVQEIALVKGLDGRDARALFDRL